MIEPLFLTKYLQSPLFIKEINEHINQYIEVFKNVEILSISSCKLYSLENLPNFPNLTKIELNDNNLTEKEIIKLKKYPLLSEIYAANNKIKNFEDLKELSKMRELHLLDFTDNPICKSKDYRETIFKKCIKLFKKSFILY